MTRQAQHIYRYIFLLICITLFLNQPALAQSGKAAVIQLKQGPIQINANKKLWLDSRPANATEPQLVYIHFVALPTLAERSDLLRKGIILFDYIPDNTFSAFINPGVSS